MSVITIIWSMTAAASLMLALVHLFIWIGQRDRVAHLAFSMIAVGVAAFGAGELAMMYAHSPSRYAVTVRWMHVPTWVMVVSFVWFTRTYLRAGRPWLAWSVIGLRTLTLIINFSLPLNINFRQVTAIKQVSFLGEPVHIAATVPNPWMPLAHASILFLLVFLVDASISVWRRGDRRSAVLVGGSMVFFISQSMVQLIFVLWGMVAIPLSLSPGYLIMLIAMAFELSRDIVRGTRAARRLHEEEERTRLAVRAAGVGFWSYDRHRDEVWASEVARKHLGLASHLRLTAGSILNAIHAEDREVVKRALNQAVSGGGEIAVEHRTLRQAGPVRWVAVRGSMEGGDSVMMHGVTMDITERKTADERFRLAIEASPSAIVVVDPGGQIVLANKQTEQLFGYARHELLGQEIETLVALSMRESHVRLRASFLDAPQSRPMGNGRDLHARRKDGTEFLVEVALNPITMDGGVLVLCVIVDISSRRQAELEIEQLRENLSHAGRVSMVGQLASAIAHEINQPLGAILRNAEAAELVLEQSSPDLAELRAIVIDIQKDDHRAGEVIDRLRRLLKRREIEKRPLSMSTLLNETVALVRPFAAGLKVVLAIDVRPDLLRVLGDSIHLQQVVLNLLLNAVHAVRDQTTARRQVLVRAGLDDARTARVVVVDRGCGIAPDRLSKVFEPFFTTKKDGMGMGLPISKTIIEAHGGRIWAEHTPGGGATVCFTVPACAVE